MKTCLPYFRKINYLIFAYNRKNDAHISVQYKVGVHFYGGLMKSINKRLLFYTITGFFFVSILGALSHFFYEWSDSNKLIGFFSPVNESVWEHMKLFIFPMILYSFFMASKLKSEYPCVQSALLLGTAWGCLLIPVFYYTYTGAVGYHVAAIDIAIFFISTVLTFRLAYKTTISCKVFLYEPLIRIIIIILVLFFILFTYNPPNIPLFKG